MNMGAWAECGFLKSFDSLHRRDPETTPPIWVRDVELEIRYLRGKSAYRGVHNTDPDLGPFQHAVT